MHLLSEQLCQLGVSDRGFYFLERVGRLLGLSKTMHQGDDDARGYLINEVRELNDDELVSVEGIAAGMGNTG